MADISAIIDTAIKILIILFLRYYNKNIIGEINDKSITILHFVKNMANNTQIISAIKTLAFLFYIIKTKNKGYTNAKKPAITFTFKAIFS